MVARVRQGHAGRVTAVCFAPDESVLCTACTDGKARVWDVATGECRHTLEGHSQHIPAMAITPDGRLLATVSGDGMIRTWEVATGQELDIIDWAASGAVNLCRFTPRGLGASGGSLLVTAHIDLKRNEGRILMWDVDRANSKVPVRGYCKQLPSATMPYKDRIEAMDVGTNEDGEVVLAFGGAVGAFGVRLAHAAAFHSPTEPHRRVSIGSVWRHGGVASSVACELTSGRRTTGGGWMPRWWTWCPARRCSRRWTSTWWRKWRASGTTCPRATTSATPSPQPT